MEKLIQKIQSLLLLGLFLLFFLSLLPIASTVSAIECQEPEFQGNNCSQNFNPRSPGNYLIGWCFNFVQEQQGGYLYTRYNCNGQINNPPPDYVCTASSNSSGYFTETELSTSMNGCWATSPSGCGEVPTCTGGPGGGNGGGGTGECYGYGQSWSGQCPEAYVGQNLNLTLPSYRV